MLVHGLTPCYRGCYLCLLLLFRQPANPEQGEQRLSEASDQLLISANLSLPKCLDYQITVLTFKVMGKIEILMADLLMKSNLTVRPT